MIQRGISKILYDSLKRKEITILIGARQVGKTTLLQKIMGDLEQQGEKVLFMNLDIENDAKYFDSQQILLNRIQLEFGQHFGYVFIDEIQQKANAGKFLKGLFDLNLPYKFVVTGSGSLELKEHISEALTGRKHLIEMYPVSFKEFIDYKTNYKYSDKLNMFCELEQEKLNLFLIEFLRFGGYPKVVISDGIQLKQEVMNEIFTSYITKDITYLLGVRTPHKFTKLIQLLAIQCGGIINHSQLASDVGINVETLNNYLWYAEQTFVIKNIRPFFTNAKKELTKSETVYFNDLGMCHFGQGKYGVMTNNIDGLIFQNFVYHLLQKGFVNDGIGKINYWRTKNKAEVDFVVNNSGENLPIEVKYSELKKATVSRSFRSFIEKYKPSNGYIVNLKLDMTLTIGETEVYFIPYWKLMF